jgi:hypothetical protein
MTCDNAVVDASIVGVWRAPIGWGSLRLARRARRRVRIGRSDPALTPVAGMLAVTELVDRLDVVGRSDAMIGRSSSGVGAYRRRAAGWDCRAAGGGGLLGCTGSLARRRCWTASGPGAEPGGDDRCWAGPPVVRRHRRAVSADPRARRRRTLHPDQRALPLDELAELDTVYGYSFIVTDLDVTSGDRAAAVEHWYRHRTQVENVFRDANHGAALRHLPSGYPEVNQAWMWGALLAASLTGWLHQPTAATAPDGALLGHGARDGQAMIATLRHRLIRVPARLVRHAGTLTLRLPPGYHLLDEVLTRIRALPAPS